MRVRTSRLGLTLVIAASLCTGCPPKRPDRASTESKRRTGMDKAVVAKIGDEEITLKEYQQRIDRLPDYVQPRFATVEGRKRQLVALIGYELLAQEAARRGYGTDPRVIDAVKDAYAREAVDARMKTAGKSAQRDVVREKLVAELRAKSKAHVDPARVKKALSSKN